VRRDRGSGRNLDDQLVHSVALMRVGVLDHKVDAATGKVRIDGSGLIDQALANRKFFRKLDLRLCTRMSYRRQARFFLTHHTKPATFNN
jgi:hypothetical protein